MSHPIQRHPQVVYANALRNKGLLASWMHKNGRIEVNPDVASSQNPEDRIPLCVEHMDDDELKRFTKEALVQVEKLREISRQNSCRIAYCFDLAGASIHITGIASLCAYGVNQFAPSSLRPSQYAFAAIAVLAGGVALDRFSDYLKATSDQKQNYIVLKVADNNYKICQEELAKREKSPDPAAQILVPA